MTITKLVSWIACPVCGDTHRARIETISDVKKNGIHYGLVKCGTIYAVQFTTEDGEVIDILSTQDGCKMTKDERIKTFADFAKQIITERSGLPSNAIDEKIRTHKNVVARNIYFAIMRMKFGESISLVKIASYIKWRPDHTTVIHGINDVKSMTIDPTRRDEYKLFTEILNEIFPPAT